MKNNRLNLIKIFSIYGLYLGVSWGIYHLMITLVSFFHFQLGHKVGVIEDWIFDQGWVLVVLPKFLSFYIFYKIYTMDEYSRFPIKSILLRYFDRPRGKIVVGLIFFWMMQIYLWGMPKYESNSITNTLYDSFFGGLLLYFLDFFLLFLMEKSYPIFKTKDEILKGFGCSLLFILSLSYLYPFNLFSLSFNTLCWAFINFFFLLSFISSFTHKMTYFNGVLWILFVTIPVSIFYKMEPIYSSKVNSSVEMRYYVIIFLLVILYTKFVHYKGRIWRKVPVPDKV